MTLAALSLLMVLRGIYEGQPLTLPSCNPANGAARAVTRIHTFCSSGRQLYIEGAALLDSCWQGGEDVRFARCLDSEDVERLSTAIAEADFFNLPGDLDTPPSYVDEPVVAIWASSGAQTRRARASGLDRATTSGALRFRGLCQQLVGLSQRLGSPCGASLKPSSQRTTPVPSRGCCR